MRNATILILSDDREFARTLTACWQGERNLPGISVVSSDLWMNSVVEADLLVIGPLKPDKLSGILQGVDSKTAAILCCPADATELSSLRKKYPRVLHVPMREDWPQVVLLVAGEALRRCEAMKMARQAEQHAARSANLATLGRYMLDMKHNVNNALTSLLGNAELLMLEPGELSGQSLSQIKTIHMMALRINEVVQKFSSLASEMRESETASQAETESVGASRELGA